MECKPTEISSSKMFEGYNKRYKHFSTTLGCSMTFHIYFPPSPSPSPSHKFPVSPLSPFPNFHYFHTQIHWLSGFLSNFATLRVMLVKFNVSADMGFALFVSTVFRSCVLCACLLFIMLMTYAQLRTHCDTTQLRKLELWLSISLCSYFFLHLILSLLKKLGYILCHMSLLIA